MTKTGPALRKDGFHIIIALSLYEVNVRLKNILQNKPLLILIIAVLLLAALAFVTAGSRSVSFVESAVGAVVKPVQGFAMRASDAIFAFFQRVFSTTDADQENEQLRAYIAELEENQSNMQELQQENERLRALLNYTQEESENVYLTARVIAKNQNVWFDVFTINAGRNAGVKEDMPVVCADGLIGRVTDVAATYSKVTSIIDTSSDISVMVQRTRDNAMARGAFRTTQDNQMELYYLPAGGDLVPGDVIVTNGLGGVFPKGITVGTVTEVMRTAEEENDRNAVIQSSVDFRHIEEVMIVTQMDTEAAE